MDAVLKFFGLKSVGGLGQEDDLVDRLSRFHSVILLVVLAIIVTTKQFVGEQINCWLPQHFSKSQEEYVNDYCWVRNTYKLDIEKDIPKEWEKREMITYYQWIPVILLIEALFFYIPRFVWRTFRRRSGIDLPNMVLAGLTFTQTEMAEVREKTLKYMTSQMDRYLARYQTRVYKSPTISVKQCLVYCKCLRGSYLVILYFIVKVLYVTNAIGQLFLMDYFLGTDFHMYGIKVIKAALSGIDWTAASRFPLTTMCDFKVRRVGNVHPYTVQCVLPINVFSEKIFLFLWFWIFFVAFVTSISLLIWLIRIAYKAGREQYVIKHLQYLKKLSDSEKKHIKFFTDYLKQDGVFIMRILGMNTDTITVTEFINSLWENYNKKELIRGKNGSLENLERIISKEGKGKSCMACCIPSSSEENYSNDETELRQENKRNGYDERSEASNGRSSVSCCIRSSDEPEENIREV